MAATAENAEGDIPPGTVVLGRYQVLGKLAQGGMAEVYLARQVGPGGYQKLVVTKRVRPHLSKDEDFVGMFVNEARLAAMINHPNVVQIFDLGEEPSTDPAGSGTDWFLAMEYLDGRDMLQVGRSCRSHNKAVPFDVTARIISDACAGLEHAHNLKGGDGKSLDLVHRDMSPENIIITFEGQVKVVDFGIAKAADNSIRTQAGQIKGKLGYVAPEAILGKPVDARADIFAVGATLYLFLSGRPAFTGNSPMEIFERSLKSPPSPQEVNPRVPPVLDEICMKALAQDRDRRYRTAGEVRAALDAYLSSTGRPLAAPQLSQFMRILFPPDKDPVRQRIDKLVADAQTFAPPRRSPSPRTVSVPQVPMQSAPAPVPADDGRTAVHAPRAVEIGPAPPATYVEIASPTASLPVPRASARVGPSHLRSVGVSDDLPDLSNPSGERASEADEGKTQLTGRLEPTVGLERGAEQSIEHNTAESLNLVRTVDVEAIDSDQRAAHDDTSASLDIDLGSAEAAAGTLASEANTVPFRARQDGMQDRAFAAGRSPETGVPQGTELPPPVEPSLFEPRGEEFSGGPESAASLLPSLEPSHAEPEVELAPRQEDAASLPQRFAMALLGIATGTLILFIALALSGKLPLIIGD